jgi:uncharacterized membrane protein YeaQ/YmgE (transglycosylase-associated protein family)
MLDLFGWDVGMSTFAAIMLVVGALAIGVVAHYIGEVTIGYEWAIVAVAALVGGYVGSEAFGTLSTWGVEFEGLFILPALIGGVVLGAAVDAITRFATSGSYVHEPRPI